jgi:flagellar biosynthesis protein FliQ
MGESAIAAKAELAGKVMILCIAVPVIIRIFGAITSLMGSV